jgi:citrate lyase subunit beta / citryl-CoA lyase
VTPRTYLFVPGDRPERFDKALASGADAVVLDLEDAVAVGHKTLAREAIAHWLQRSAPDARARVVVRINDATSKEFDADLAMLAAAGCGVVMLPKAETAAQVAAVSAVLRDMPVLALVESAAGVAGVQALARVPGVQRLVFGTLDFALDLDIAPEPAGLAHAAGCIAIASRAAGLPPPVAGVTPELDDEPRLLADLAWARAIGFAAKLCIHPRQVAPVHAALRPGDAELDWARRVLAAAEGAAGAVQLDSRMIDKPVLQRAQALLARSR